VLIKEPHHYGPHDSPEQLKSPSGGLHPTGLRGELNQPQCDAGEQVQIDLQPRQYLRARLNIPGNWAQETGSGREGGAGKQQTRQPKPPDEDISQQLHWDNKVFVSNTPAC